MVSAPNEYRLSFRTIGEAVAEFARRLNAETDEHYTIMNEFFGKNLRRSQETGGYYMDMKSHKMCISWGVPLK